MTNNQLTDKRLAQLAKRNFCQTRGEEYTPFGDEVVSMAAELQERLKIDREPVAEVLSSRPGNDTSTIDRALPVGTTLYRHAQTAPASEPVGIVRHVETGAGKGVHVSLYQPLPEGVELFAAPQPDPVVPEDVLDALQKVARMRLDLNDFDGDRRGIADCLGDAEEALIEVVNRRAAMLQAGNCRENSNSSTNNCREIAETSTNRSREHFISLCNEFWNWSEMDLVCADDRGYELRMEWDGKVFNHPVTQALWRMYQAAPTGIPIISDRWIPVSERMPEKADEVLCAKEFDGPGDWRQKVGYYLAGKWTVYGASWTPTHWMPLPAAPQEVNGE